MLLFLESARERDNERPIRETLVSFIRIFSAFINPYVVPNHMTSFFHRIQMGLLGRLSNLFNECEVGRVLSNVQNFK